MTNQPLNQDALDHLATVVFGCTIEEWNEHDDDEKRQVLAPYRRNIEAYLAVAQPVVNSVEELEALPPYSVLLDGLGATWEKTAAGLPLPWASLHYTGNVKSSWLMHRSARFIVLFRPEVKP